MVEDRKVRIKSKHMESDDWVTPEKLPEPAPSAMQQWVDAAENGVRPYITKEDMLNLTSINQAAALSSMTCRRVEISKLVESK